MIVLITRIVILQLILALRFGLATSYNQPTLVIIDGFTEYLSGLCKHYCQENNIQLVEIVSPYICNLFASQGRDVPEDLRAPIQKLDILNWAKSNNIIYDFTSNEIEADNFKVNENVYVISESDSGVSTAELIADTLKLVGNGISPHLRNKFLSNQRASEAGIPIVKQALVSSYEEALDFMNELWLDIDEVEERKCVLKPYRGVASDGVYLVQNEDELRQSFDLLFNKPKFGGGVNDQVLMQEFADGQEFAVDTIAQNGEIKVVALWKYHKLPLNGAPFVYQCSELISSDGKIESDVCDYCLNILKAQSLIWGPTHTEIKYTSKGPRLIEINARWHAQHFQPIVDRCLGYNAVTTTLEAFFQPEKFESIPDRPDTLISFGRILHLISTVEGKVKFIHHTDEIKALDSTILLNVEPEVGDYVTKTVNIRTDCGYVLQCHDDLSTVEKDYDRIVSLQSTLFDVWGSDEEEKNAEELEISQIPALSYNNLSVESVDNSSNIVKAVSLKIFPWIKRFVLVGLLGYLSSNLFAIVIPLFRNALLQR